VEYAGTCPQARQVGGDYFDFLSLGPQRLGLIMGDVYGKWIAAALLMANLQACSGASRYWRSTNLRYRCNRRTPVL
jgi:serine phosphatase RsbU (regulator of sigma subunit)